MPSTGKPRQSPKKRSKFQMAERMSSCTGSSSCSPDRCWPNSFPHRWGYLHLWSEELCHSRRRGRWRQFHSEPCRTDNTWRSQAARRWSQVSSWPKWSLHNCSSSRRRSWTSGRSLEKSTPNTGRRPESPGSWSGFQTEARKRRCTGLSTHSERRCLPCSC